MSLWDLVLTKGQGESFDVETIQRIKKQEMQFKPETVSILSLIPLAIIAYLVVKK
jgi:uncharacterized protein YdcH (DUF465 family)